MTILLLSPRYTLDSQAVRAAATAYGWHVVRLASRRLPSWMDESDLVFYGEPGFVDAVAWAAGIALLRPSLGWLPHLPPAYRKRDVQHSTLGQARALQAPCFIKPALEEKVFPAAIYADGGALSAATSRLPDRLRVLTADPVHWEVEYRAFILNRCIQALSPSLRRGISAQVADGTWYAPAQEIAAATAFLTSMLADSAVFLPRAVVVDVGLLAGLGWAVVEANAVWAAGLYGCDAATVLPALAQAAVPRRTVAPDDRPWVRVPSR